LAQTEVAEDYICSFMSWDQFAPSHSCVLVQQQMQQQRAQRSEVMDHSTASHR